MRLRILLPTDVIVDEEVRKVRAEGTHGSFTLLPRHVDYVVAILPGILSYETADGEEKLLAVDSGILVKCGRDVRLSTRNAMRAPDLAALRQAVETQLRATDEREHKARLALARLEATFVRQFLTLEEWR